MTKKKWKGRIIQCCDDAGTYKPYFEDVIDTLADILQRRDEAQNLFKKSHDDMLVSYTNKSGASNLELHPALKTVNALNRDALQYWKELGLTPATLKKMNESAFKEQSQSGFSLALVEALSNAGA